MNRDVHEVVVHSLKHQPSLRFPGYDAMSHIRPEHISGLGLGDEGKMLGAQADSAFRRR